MRKLLNLKRAKQRKHSTNSIRTDWLKIIGGIAALLPLFTFAYTAVRQASLDEEQRYVEAINLLVSQPSNSYKNLAGFRQEAAIRILRDTKRYCESTISIVSDFYCKLPADAFDSTGNSEWAIAKSAKITINDLCKSCKSNVTKEICKNFKNDGPPDNLCKANPDQQPWGIDTAPYSIDGT